MSETDASLPKYLCIAEDIRGRIERGELGVGDEVESERELVVRWSVARPTAAKALNTLRQSGFVESRRGAGTFVARRRPAMVRDGNTPGWVPGGAAGWVGSGDTGSSGSSPLSATACDDVPGAEAGDAGDHRAHTVVLAAEVAALPEIVTEIFGSSGMGIVRRMVMGSEAAGQLLRTSWYPHEFASAAPRLLESVPIAGGAGNYLQSALGKAAARRGERVCARGVAEDERVHLGVESGAPVLVRQTVRYDDSGGVLWFDETVYPPGYWVA